MTNFMAEGKDAGAGKFSRSDDTLKAMKPSTPQNQKRIILLDPAGKRKLDQKMAESFRKKGIWYLSADIRAEGMMNEFLLSDL